MRAKGRLVVFGCALVALCALPAAAGARPDYNVRPAGTELFLELGERGEYEVEVEASGRQRVVLRVSEGLFTATEYSTEGRVNSKRLEADFGALGRIDIDVGLRPRNSWSYPPIKRCKGPATVEVPGSFRGTIKFSGEGDIPPFSVKRGEVSFTHRFKRVCKRRQPTAEKDGKKQSKLDVSLFEVGGEVEGRTSFLGALNFASRKGPARSFGLLVAAAVERREGVAIESSTLTFVNRESFRVSAPGKKPEAVEVMKLPEPFAGRALYKRKAGSPPRWIGNLTVDFPGVRAVPLTGFESGLKARFCRGSSEAEAEKGCAYRDGSGSQPLALAPGEVAGLHPLAIALNRLRR